MSVKGMIFAAGLGTRLKPFTLNHPKAMVPVGGRPIIERVIQNMVNAGITEIVVNVHHFANQVIDYLKNCPINGVSLCVSDERGLLLDTGGGILNARCWFADADAVVVHNADILTDVDIKRLVSTHLDNKADATLLVAPRQTSRYLFFDKSSNRLLGWSNLSTGAVRPATFLPNDDVMNQRAYSGIHVFSPHIFNALERYKVKFGPVFSIIPFYVDECKDLLINGYEQSDSYNWLDIGKPETLALAEELYSKLS